VEDLLKCEDAFIDLVLHLRDQFRAVLVHLHLEVTHLLILALVHLFEHLCLQSGVEIGVLDIHLGKIR
jgi:hypothetical protein